MTGRIHRLGPKTQGNARRRTLKIGENEYQRLIREGWIPEFLATANDPRIEQIRMGGQKVLLGKAFDPKTGIRLDDHRSLVWTKGESSYRRLKRDGWQPRLLLNPTDSWIGRERELGLQQICISEPYHLTTGARMDDDRVLVWTK